MKLGAGAFARALALALTMLAARPAMAVTAAVVGTGYSAPVDLVNAHDGSGRLFVAEQGGRIRVLGAPAPQSPFLDIAARVSCCGERGLLGVAFHPDYRHNGRFFVDYTRAADGATVIAEYAVGPDAQHAAPASEKVLLVIPQPYENHNGGALRFGPDGLLYVGMGDGGSGNDPDARAQDPQQLLGKILRLDVDHGVPYAIPPGNPFADGTLGRPEVLVLGARNPWRFSFDRQTGDLVVGDVGQGAWEEVDRLSTDPAGANLGWRVMEGRHCTGLSGPVACGDPRLTLPVVEYDHSAGNCAVTGGYVYRGAAVAPLLGRYVFADYCTGRRWSAAATGAAAWTAQDLLDVGSPVSTFGEDESGELYFADYGRGEIRKLVPDAGEHAYALEYYLPALDHYFVTAEPGDIAALDAGLFPGWRRTGEVVPALLAARGDVEPVCRFYIPPAQGNSHFLSVIPEECAAVRERFHYVEEGPLAMHMAVPDRASGACPAGFAPVFRVWNGRADSNHRYTTSRDARAAMVAAGGIAEGFGPDAVALCGPL